jgi:hypothetical protein
VTSNYPVPVDQRWLGMDKRGIPYAELAIVAGTHKDRRRFVESAKKANGRHAKRVAKHVLTAGRDLCEAVGRSGGQDTESVEVARQELVRVRGD